MSPQGAPRDQNEYKSPLRLYSVRFSLVFQHVFGGAICAIYVSWSALLGKFKKTQMLLIR